MHEGDRLIQLDLADTLRAIAKDGPRAFYQGHVAALIAGSVAKAGGILNKDDLADYRAIERDVVRGKYRGYDIVSAPPPSSGGVHLIEMLNILEGFDLGRLSREAALHDMIEAMKRAYADRATFMGDPDAVKMPIAGLISKKYAASLRARSAAAPHHRARSAPATRPNSKAATPRISRSSIATATRCRIPTR